MKREEFIAKRGEEAYKRKLEQDRIIQRIRRIANPKIVKIANNTRSFKGARYYEQTLKYKRTGIQGERNKIRAKHRKQYRTFKDIIAPESQLHHQWIPKTADYTGIALIEADQHIYGFIDVIHVLDGEITLFREAEIIGGMKQ